MQGNVKNKFLKRSFNFYRTRPGKDKYQKEQKLNEIVSHIAVSVTEKAYTINPNLGSIDKLFDESTQKNIDELLNKEFDKYSSRGTIIKKIETIIKERAGECKKENLKSSINVTLTQYQEPPTYTMQVDTKQISDEYIPTSKNIQHKEVPKFTTFRANNESKSMAMQNIQNPAVRPIRSAPLPPISRDNSITEKRASQSSIGSLKRPTTPPSEVINTLHSSKAPPAPPLPPPEVINTLSPGKIPPSSPPLPLQHQVTPSHADLWKEIHQGKQLKKVEQISGDPNWNKGNIDSSIITPKAKEVPKGIMGSMAKAMEERRKKWVMMNMIKIK